MRKIDRNFHCKDSKQESNSAFTEMYFSGLLSEMSFLGLQHLPENTRGKKEIVQIPNKGRLFFSTACCGQLVGLRNSYMLEPKKDTLTPAFSSSHPLSFSLLQGTVVFNFQQSTTLWASRRPALKSTSPLCPSLLASWR